MTAKARSVYILRHGIRQDFESKAFVSPTGRTQDPPLSARGLAQAEALALHMATTPPPTITHIFCSPFSRCIQTVLPLSRALGVPLRIEPGVGEWFKKSVGTDAEAEAPSPAETSAALNLTPRDIDLSYTPLRASIPRESPHDVHARFAAVATELVARADADGLQGDLLIVTHAAGLIAAVRGLLDWQRAPVVAGVCTFTKLTQDPLADRKWRVEVCGEAGHLKELGGVLYDWQFPGEFAPEAPAEAIFALPPLNSLL
ncbi:hypothetical protein HDU98_000740 [Podochytrium sp. JEL0797]|nr:hypothetical protein HDU98_000740 [Podochytrium sp. JEL0797]